jgi:hypothetical protein
MADPMTDRSSLRQSWPLWCAGFLAFPVAGLAGSGVVGRVDGATAALLGGLVAGLVLGAGQSLVSRGRLDPRRWVPATAVGMGLGLLLGATSVDYGTGWSDLVVMGALTGCVLGPAQAMALPRGTAGAWIWAAAVPPLWALAWAVTTVGGVHVEEQFVIFGAYGAIVFSALSGLLLHHLVPYRR